MKIKNALISVFNKSKIVKLCQTLVKKKINIMSTKGTRKILRKNKIPCSKVSDYTKCKEMLHGKIKTLHPKIYSGILSHPISDSKILKKNKILSINLIIVNFYSFKNKKKKINNYMKYIDIGGPSLLRAAAKNYKNVICITNIKDYKFIQKKILTKKEISNREKLKLAMKAFQYSAKYEKKIYNFFKKKYYEKYKKKKKIFPKKITLLLEKKKNLLYGENPHQKSALYIDKNLKNKNLIFKKIQGKKLSYNNIIDANIALECVNQFKKPSCVIVKHGTPCGASTKKNILEAYNHAYLCDPNSSFGGIIAFNKKLKSHTVKKILNKQFVEIIISPKISINAKNFLKKKKNLRVLITNNYKKNFFDKLEIQKINNQYLIQEKDYDDFDKKKWSIVSTRKPTQSEIKDAIFSWKIVKFSKSNAIVYAYKNSTIAIGNGQTSRIFSIQNANSKLYLKNQKIPKLTMASDAFLPFKDNVSESHKFNISCIIQPGGSIKDQEIIQEVNKRNISMIFTHIRHFKH